MSEHKHYLVSDDVLYNSEGVFEWANCWLECDTGEEFFDCYIQDGYDTWDFDEVMANLGEPVYYKSEDMVQNGWSETVDASLVTLKDIKKYMIKQHKNLIVI
jgi:hypothetical protein